jgi:hypothetical protein
MPKRDLTGYAPSDLVLSRSDQGDGGWSLHIPDASQDEEEAGGDLLLSGPASWDEATDDWSAPTPADYEKAFALWQEANERESESK